MRFSPSTLGWYPTFVDYPSLPADIIEVPDEIWRALMGKQIEADENGQPREAVLVVLPVVPSSVTMRQARLALLHADRLGMVEMAIAGMESPQREAAQIEWEFAATVDRASPLLAMLTSALGMTDEELDQLFQLAGQI